MGRIERKFTELKRRKEKALIAYITAGDPDLPRTREIVFALAAAGADILEIGVPFSDPTADGPAIQAASRRSLLNGTNLAAILEMIASVRRESEIPIVLFGYYNPILCYGCGKFAKAAVKSGVDGVLVVDLPPEEADELRAYTDPEGIDFISLMAPTTGISRRKKIIEKASGFLYYISITGVTGTGKPLLSDIERETAQIRRLTDLPVAVGFGITTPEDASGIASFADGVVVGSAIVRLIEENSGRKDLAQIVFSFARDLKKAIAR
ncbi:MAG: tryptophan synthase subunit alpha [Syntrophales bacterium]